MSVGIGVASGGFRREVRLLNVEDPASTCGRVYCMQAQRAWQDFEGSLRRLGCNALIAKAFVADHKVTELPDTANAARAPAPSVT